MALELKEVRVPTKRVRAEKLLAALEANGPVNEYNAAGAIDPSDGVALLRSTSAGMAMTLADGTVAGETMHIKCTKIGTLGTDTIVVTPATFADGTTITFDAENEFIVLIWIAATGWTKRPGNSATVA